jgi:phosphatidate phosphatase APP1
LTLTQTKNKPLVWQLSALELDNKTLVTGVIINSLPFAYDKQTGYFKNFIKSVSSFFISVYKQNKISITVGNITKTTETNSFGGFRVVFDETLSIVNISIRSNDSDELEIVQSYPIFFKKTSGKIDVISDVDDTIIISYTKNIFKRMGSILFTPPRRRKPIGFSQNLLKVLSRNGARVQYISKSESNLFAMLTSIIQHNRLPNGNLILTSYLKFRQLFNPKKGRYYKFNRISFIIKNTRDKKYILIGDDTQKDMEVYTKIVKEFPDRVLKVYIRQTKFKIKAYQKIMLNNLKDTGIDYLYFDDDSNIDFETEYKKLTEKTS